MNTLTNTRLIILGEDVRVCEELAGQIRIGDTLIISPTKPQPGNIILYESEGFTHLCYLTNLFFDGQIIGVVESWKRRHKNPYKAV